MKSQASRRAKRRRTWLVVLIVMIAVSAAGYFYYTRYLMAAEAPAAPALQTTTVRKGDIVITAVGSGNLMSGAEISLGFRSGGVLVELPVKVGDRVVAGQVLARLDDTAATLQVTQAELNLAQAQAKLETARRAVTPTLAIAQVNLEAAQTAYDALVKSSQYGGDRLTPARVNLEQATAQLALAQAAYDAAWDPARDWELTVKDRAKALENERAATLRALDKAKADLQVARANYNLAVLNLDDTGALQTAQAKILSAQQAVDTAQTGAEVQAAEWSVQQAELALTTARLTFENLTLTAPATMTVVSVAANVGETVGTSPILKLADVDTLHVRFYLEESDLDKVAVGHKVSVLFDALPNKPFTGAVTRIDPALVTVSNTPAVQAWARLDPLETPRTLPVGLTAEVEIIAGEAYKTLLIPVQALRELASGQFAVFVVDANGDLKLRPVEVGLRDFANAQILSGLEQGEVISTGTVATE
ncbi:MAG: efflux RND transporter periplasmic adaptor subunit [Anaerolineae bacterium]